MKKTLSVFLIVTLLLNTFTPFVSYAEYTESENVAINLFSNILETLVDDGYEAGVEYTEGCYKGITTENRGIKITEYTCTDTNINIPEKINGYTVKEIGEEVYKDKGIQSLIIPESIEVIGTGAFSNNNFNEDFTLRLPENLKRIEKNGFSSSNIKHYSFNNKLEYIGDYAFYNNYSNSREDIDGELIFPDTLKYIGTGAFELVAIKKLELGNGIEEIGRYAFQDSYFNRRYLSEIEELILPKTLKYIGGESFQCTKIKKLTIENGIEEIGRYAFQGSCNGRISSYTDLYIPESVKIIGTGAFQSNRLLKNVEIGSGNGTIELKQYAFDSCGINNIKINKSKMIMEGSSLGSNPYDKIELSGELEQLSNQNIFSWYNNGNYGKEGNISLTLNLTGKLLDLIRDYNNIKEINIGPDITEISTIIFRNFNGNTIKIPGNVETIHDKQNGHYNMFQKEIILENGIKEIGANTFNYSYNIQSIEIPSSIEKIGEEAFRSSHKLKNLYLNEGLKEIGTGAFKWTDIENILIPDSVEFIGKDAFQRTATGDGNGGSINQKTIVYVINDIIPEISDPEKEEYIRLYKVDFTGDFNEDIYPNRKILNKNEKIIKPEDISKNGHEFLGWFDKNSDTEFDFENTPITENKILHAKWKSLEKKAEEKTENIVYTNETTASIDNEIQNERIDNSTTINLISKEIEKKEIKKEEEKLKIQETEVQASVNKKAEYQGGLEIYLEKTENIGTENEDKKRIEGTIKFSSPVAVKIPISSDIESVKVQVKHGGEEFGYNGLTTNPINSCENGEAVNNKYNGEYITTTNNNGIKYALIYTCSASTFVAYSENAKIEKNTESITTPAAGGGRTINSNENKSKEVEQEHNSAKKDNEIDNKANKEIINNEKNQAHEKVEEKIKALSPKSLTRGELAIFTNIILDIFPKLTENKKNINEYCTEYTDYNEFSRREQKAVSKLCRLAIMGIHEDDKTPLETFGVHNLSTNEEFIKVVNRMTDKFSNDELKDLKSALSTLEENKEDNLVFGTVVDVFKKVKELFN